MASTIFYCRITNNTLKKWPTIHYLYLKVYYSVQIYLGEAINSVPNIQISPLHNSIKESKQATNIEESFHDINPYNIFQFLRDMKLSCRIELQHKPHISLPLTIISPQTCICAQADYRLPCLIAKQVIIHNIITSDLT